MSTNGEHTDQNANHLVVLEDWILVLEILQQRQQVVPV